LPAHATAVTVVVVAGAIVDQPLHPHHHRRRLRPRHDPSCWRGPRPLPLTSRLIGRWSPWTPMPLHGVIEADHVLSTVGGLAPSGLHRRTGPRHQAVKGKRTEKKKRTTTHATSRWSPARGGTGNMSGGADLHRSMGPTQGPLTPQTGTTSPTSSTLSLAAPPALPSSEAGPSDFGMPPDLKSPCGNQLLCWFAHFTAPSGKGRAPGSWDSTTGPSQ
jgi:hypothetical protein